MPLDTTGYTDFSIVIDQGDVATPQALEVRVDPTLNSGADILCSYAGVFMFAATGSSDQWRRGSLVASLPTAGRRWSSGSVFRGPGWTVFRGGTATLSLASISNAGGANFAGWAVDAAQIEAVTGVSAAGDITDHLQVEALLAVRDTDGVLYRVSYQVMALGNFVPSGVQGAGATC